jgi:signal transduction histidine kinase
MANTVREMQKMKQAFVAMISHDLRTPLANLQTYLNLITEGVFGNVHPQILSGAQKQENNVGRLIRLINDLLTLEKMESGNLQMSCKIIYLENVIEKSIDAVDEYAKKNKIELVFNETNAEVNADPDRVIQVLINLLSNAIKFSPENAKVEIKTIEAEDFIEVQVVDHGRGVPQAYKELIFEKYKQVKADDDTKKGGTGLGLPICKMIIEQLGGKIGVRSEDGKGSTFWFTLPAISDGDGSVVQTNKIEETNKAS